MDRPPLWLARTTRGPDSIGWAGLAHDRAAGCIHPPPFGTQCTLLREDALAACLTRLPGCVAITCPDPRESHIGRKPGITGPICQARRKQQADEVGHGMCRPGGCFNVLLAPLPAPAGRRPPAWAAAVNASVTRRALGSGSIGVIRFRPALKDNDTQLFISDVESVLPAEGSRWQLQLRHDARPGHGAARHDTWYALELAARAAPRVRNSAAIELRRLASSNERRARRRRRARRADLPSGDGGHDPHARELARNLERVRAARDGQDPYAREIARNLDRDGPYNMTLIAPGPLVNC
jgi:hypothetical protein